MPPKKWVKGVRSRALWLPRGTFTRSSKEIAKELKKAALASKSRKGTPFQSAMSMLNFYINRQGKNLKGKNKKRLEQAKVELRKVFNRAGKPNKAP